MSIVILHPRLFANLLEKGAMPHRSLKVRREIEKMRSKKRQNERAQINLTANDASILAAGIYTSDLSRFESGMEMRDYMEQIAKSGVSNEGMENNSYIGYSSSEWKAMIEIASGLESTLNLKEVPETVLYDLTQHYAYFEDYLTMMIGRAYGAITQEEIDRVLNEMNVDHENDEEEEVQPSIAARAFGATPAEHENTDQTDSN